MTTCTDTEGYNNFSEFASYSYELVKYLIENNELVFKLLKYNTPSAWKESTPNLTKEEKGALVYGGIGDGAGFNIFLSNGMPDVVVNEKSLLTVAPYFLSGRNRSIANLSIMMEIYVHYKIVSLSNYKSRTDVIAQQLLETFNGAILDELGIGRMYFDKLGFSQLSSERAGQLPFKGRTILFGINMA